MADYKVMYTKLFNAVTDSISILQKAQIETEEMFTAQKETELIVLEAHDDSEKF